jgi:hypothetical protein
MQVERAAAFTCVALEVTSGLRKPPHRPHMQPVGIDLVAIGKYRPQPAKQQAKKYASFSQISPDSSVLPQCRSRCAHLVGHNPNDAMYSHNSRLSYTSLNQSSKSSKRRLYILRPLREETPSHENTPCVTRCCPPASGSAMGPAPLQYKPRSFATLIWNHHCGRFVYQGSTVNSARSTSG